MTCERCHQDIESDSTFCKFCGNRTESPTTPRRLMRLPGEGKIAGICAGLSAHLDVDVTLIRLAWVILSIVPGAFIGGVIAYVAAWVLMPSAEAGSERIVRKRLVRSEANRQVAGVCGGFAEYLGIDPTVVRVVTVILAIYPGAIVCGILAYAIAWFIIPPASKTALEPAPSTA